MQPPIHSLTHIPRVPKVPPDFVLAVSSLSECLAKVKLKTHKYKNNVKMNFLDPLLLL